MSFISNPCGLPKRTITIRIDPSQLYQVGCTSHTFLSEGRPATHSLTISSKGNCRLPLLSSPSLFPKSISDCAKSFYVQPRVCASFKVSWQANKPALRTKSRWCWRSCSMSSSGTSTSSSSSESKSEWRPRSADQGLDRSEHTNE